jgi:isopentenyl-diphosphate Delta-isomerase
MSERTLSPECGDRVVLVDEHDRALGEAGKMEVHRLGLLHRAVSVFIFDDAGRMLLQRRSRDKYHSGHLWSNACCTHPRPGEPAVAAARRRLQEEMGCDSELDFAFGFVYRAAIGDLVEHEYDHVFIGRSAVLPDPDPEEVADWRWERIELVEASMRLRPEAYTVWFRELLPKVRERLAPG